MYLTVADQASATVTLSVLDLVDSILFRNVPLLPLTRPTTDPFQDAMSVPDSR